MKTFITVDIWTKFYWNPSSFRNETWECTDKLNLFNVSNVCISMIKLQW